MLVAAERAYRETWLSLRGGDPPGDLADACPGWVVQGDAPVERADRRGPDHFARMLRADRRWGTMTARERLAHRLGVVAGAAAGRTGLAAATTATELITAMRQALARR